MSLLAYDPVRVAGLQHSMTAALSELRAISCSDPAAADAMQAARLAAMTLDTEWLPLVQRILSGAPLSKGQRRDAHIGDLDQSLIKVMAEGYGWSVQYDALAVDAAQTETVTPEEARALGAMLNEVDLRAISLDPARLGWLAQQLEIIGRDPALSHYFLANFHEWALLCNQLGWTHVLHSGGDATALDPALVEEIDEVFAGLASIQWHAVPTGLLTSAAAVVPQIDEMKPYSAALLVRSMPLRGTALVTITIDLLHRYLALPLTTGDGPWTDKDFNSGPTTADILLPLILQDPATCAEYVQRAIDDDPLLLFATARDQSLQHQAMLVATDPAYVASDAAGELLLRLIRTFDDSGGSTIDISLYGFDPAWHAFLGALVAPWLLQFAGSTGTWGTSADLTALLAFVMRDDAAAEAVLSGAQVIADEVTAAIRAGSFDIQQLAGMLGTVLQLFVNEIGREAEVSQRQAELMFNLGSIVVGHALGPAGDVGSMVGQGIFSSNGWLGDPDLARRDAGHQQQLVIASTASAIAAGTVARLIAAGLLPKGTEPPPAVRPDHPNPDHAYGADYAAWKERNGIAWGSEAQQQLDLAVLAFVGNLMTGEHMSEQQD